MVPCAKITNLSRDNLAEQKSRQKKFRLEKDRVSQGASQVLLETFDNGKRVDFVRTNCRGSF